MTHIEIAVVFAEQAYIFAEESMGAAAASAAGKAFAASVECFVWVIVASLLVVEPTVVADMMILVGLAFAIAAVTIALVFAGEQEFAGFVVVSVQGAIDFHKHIAVRDIMNIRVLVH